jgi:hypothetical protein
MILKILCDFSENSFIKISTDISLFFLQATSALKKQAQAKKKVLKSTAQLIGCFINLAIAEENIKITIMNKDTLAIHSSAFIKYSPILFIMLNHLIKDVLRF